MEKRRLESVVSELEADLVRYYGLNYYESRNKTWTNLAVICFEM